jgi:hypothetical protein
MLIEDGVAEPPTPRFTNEKETTYLVVVQAYSGLEEVMPDTSFNDGSYYWDKYVIF